MQFQGAFMCRGKRDLDDLNHHVTWQKPAPRFVPVHR
jgi:hypothetical protein